MLLSRRGLIGALAAPAIIRTAGLLMPIKPERDYLIEKMDISWAPASFLSIQEAFERWKSGRAVELVIAEAVERTIAANGEFHRSYFGTWRAV